MATLVSTFKELKAAIEDTTTTDITVTANITFESGGARINAAKENLTIDCSGFTITDNNTSTFTDTIYVNAGSGTKNITVKNAIWSGRNYYGVVGVYDGNTNTSITLQNITYTGPQFIYNKNGTSNIIDCNITLAQNGSSTQPQELGEVNRVTISGKVTVNAATRSNAIFWFTNTNSSLTVKANANFSISALSTYLMYTDSQPDIILEQNSVTKIDTLNGLFYSTGSSSHIARSFNLGQNATFIATRTASYSAPMFKCVSSFILQAGSTFGLYSSAASSSALMYFGTAAAITITSPKSVVLYNNGAKVFSFQTGSTSTPNTISIEAQMLRLWTTAKTPLTQAGGIDDTPTKDYHKEDYSQLTTTIKTTSSSVISADSNLVSGDTGYPLGTDIILLTAQVISMGNIDISVNPVKDISAAITGTTEALANIKATYDTTTLTGVASADGTFSLPLTDSMPVGTIIDITANKDFLTRTLKVVSVGSVSISSIEPLNFPAIVSPSKKSLIKRIKTDWSVAVKDTRNSGEWELYAYIDEPLTSGENTLADCLIFTKDNQNFTLSKTPTLVHKSTSHNPLTTLSWQDDEGFLLLLDTETEYISGDYSTSLKWNITEIE